MTEPSMMRHRGVSQVQMERLVKPVQALEQAQSVLQRHLPARSTKTRNSEFPLYDEADAPEWLKGNPFIRSYYRVGYTTRQCIRSVLHLHNETGNIWTHLLGFFLILVLAIHALLHLGLTRTRDHLVFAVFELCSLLMLGSSVVYHTLSGHCRRDVHDCCLALDYFGISTMIVGSFYPPVFYLFSCMKLVRFTYLAAVTGLGLVGLVGPFFPHFNSAAFYWPRLLLFTALTAMGILPTAHLYIALPTNEMTYPVFNGMFVMLSAYAAGALFYTFKFPECMFPGRFDLFLHSHQLWHFFVVVAAVLHFFVCMAAFQLWRVSGGAAGECT